MFCRPLKSTGSDALVNVTQGTLSFSSNEDQEIGGRGMANNGTVGFHGAGRTNITGPLVSTGLIGCDDPLGKVSFQATGSTIGGGGIQSGGELAFDAGTTDVTANFISTGSTAIAAGSSLKLTGTPEPTAARRLGASSEQPKPRAEYKNTTNQGEHQHTDFNVTYGTYAQQGLLTLSGSTSFRCTRSSDTQKCDAPFNQTAGETKIGAGSELENDEVHVKGGTLRGDGGKVKGNIMLNDGSKIACGSLGSTGKFHVAGNITMAAGSTFEVKIMGAESDSIVVTEGKAALGGHLAVARSPAAAGATSSRRLTERHLTEVTSTIVDGEYTGTFDSTDCVAPDCTITYGTDSVTISSTVVTTPAPADSATLSGASQNGVGLVAVMYAGATVYLASMMQ